MAVPKPPPELKRSGCDLWVAVTTDYELERHELGLLHAMASTLDVLDGLAAVVARDGP